MAGAVWSILTIRIHSDFGFVSDFGFRASDFYAGNHEWTRNDTNQD
jgi:hypothetical protein